jgi:putative hydrolase of the HAD superfamily
VKAVIFDLGNVLVPFDFKRAYARLAPLISCQPAEIPARLRSTDLVQRFETGLIEPPDFVSELGALLGFEMSYLEFCDLWSSVFMVEPLVPESLIASLARTYRLVVLSNTNAIHFPMLRANYSILSHFHAFVLSYEVGAAKPAPQIYQEAIRQAGCAPAECFFTDDIPLYVEAARQQGMDAVQFQSAAQIEQELRQRGVR